MSTLKMQRMQALALRAAGYKKQGVKAWPVSQSYFPDPKSGATPLPASKVIGSPNDTLIASRTYPPASTISPFVEKLVRPLPAFARSLEGHPVVQPQQTTARLEMRRILEQRDRVIRANAGKRLVLNMETRTGFDWIKYDRRISPRLPGAVGGLIARTAVGTVRGTTADALRVPDGTIQNLAVKGMMSDANPSAAAKDIASKPALLPAPDPSGNMIAKPESMPNANLSLIVVALVIGGMLFIMFKKGGR